MTISKAAVTVQLRRALPRCSEPQEAEWIRSLQHGVGTRQIPSVFAPGTGECVRKWPGERNRARYIPQSCTVRCIVDVSNPLASRRATRVCSVSTFIRGERERIQKYSLLGVPTTAWE